MAAGRGGTGDHCVNTLEQRLYDKADIHISKDDCKKKSTGTYFAVYSTGHHLP